MRSRALLILLALAPGLLGAAEAWKWNVVQIDKRRYVPVSDVAAFYRMNRPVSTAKNFKLTSANRVLEGRAGSREVLVNGVKYITCFPMRSKGSEVYVSAMDVSKILEPILRPGKIKSATPIRTIVLDAGHGGHDSGAVGSLGREKQFALDVVLRARALLTKAGYQVKLTRANDTFIPLEQRAAFANRFPDALFVSVHFNKSKGGGTGIETYALAPRGVPSMDEESASYSDFKQNPGNARDSENIALAAAIHSSMVRNLRMPDRGIKRARFVVIKNIRIPGVLLEGGFVDNSADARKIASGDYRQRMAQSILEGVQAYTRAVTGAGPKPTLVVSGDAPSSIPNLDEALGESGWKVQRHLDAN
jgi:N-acetylmuramoyl-L-alanine amidase